MLFSGLSVLTVIICHRGSPGATLPKICCRCSLVRCGSQHSGPQMSLSLLISAGGGCLTVGWTAAPSLPALSSPRAQGPGAQGCRPPGRSGMGSLCAPRCPGVKMHVLACTGSQHHSWRTADLVSCEGFFSCNSPHLAFTAGNHRPRPARETQDWFRDLVGITVVFPAL